MPPLRHAIWVVETTASRLPPRLRALLSCVLSVLKAIVKGADIGRDGGKDMAWVKMPNERHCRTCGVVVEQWVLLKGPGHQVAEATFCPVCYPDVKRVFDTPETSRAAA